MQEIFASQASGNLATWLALIVAIVALYFAVLGPVRQANRKELSFGSSDIAILPAPVIELPGLTIQFRGEEISGIYAVNLFVMNTGNTVIEARDFDGPIVFRFSQACKPLNLQVHEARPVSLPVNAEVANQEVVVRPLLLNPGDYFAVFVGAIGKSVEIEPMARVSGVSDFPHLLPGAMDVRESELYIVAGAALTALAIGVFAVIFEPTRAQYWGLAGLGVALSATVLSTWRRFKAIKRARWMGKGTESHKLTPASLYQLMQKELPETQKREA